jgi:hypothetical protein
MSFYGRDKRQEPEEDSKYKSDVLYINRVAKVRPALSFYRARRRW